MAMVPQGGEFQGNPGTCGAEFPFRKVPPASIRTGCAPTLVNWRKLPLIHPTLRDRILSVAEAIALSGFGKDFIALGSLNERQQQIGNGVPYAIGKDDKKTP